MIIHKKNNCRKVLLLLFIFGYYPIVDIFGIKYDTDNDILIISTKIICEQTNKYVGWPTIAKTQTGKLLVVFSGDRDWHVCPWGKTYMLQSVDNGQTWSEAKLINNTPLDDRDAGILITDKGTILVSWFNSLAFADKKSRFYNSRYKQYARHTEKIPDEIKKKWLGHWIRRSVDGGQTFSDPIPTIGNSPHGPIKLADGRLLYATNKGVSESIDDGKTWQKIGDIPLPPDSPGLSEVHAIETADGKIIALSRSNCLRQSMSNDGGHTWSILKETPMIGYPAHLTRLSNNWILATYSRRTEPNPGQKACISKDNGKTWDYKNEITLSIADLPEEGIHDYPSSWDFGYPSSVEPDDGSIYTVYYQMPDKNKKPVIMATHWKINKD